MPASRNFAVHMTADRIVAATLFPVLRDRVHADFPECTQLSAAMREQEPGYFVFTEVKALDKHGVALGQVPFVAHALVLNGWPTPFIEVASLPSDADTVRTLCSDWQGEYLLDLTHQPRVVLDDLFHLMPWELREDFELAVRRWEMADGTDEAEPADP